MGFLWSTDGYLINSSPNVVVFDADTGQFKKNIPLSFEGLDMALTPDNSRLYVIDRGVVTSIDTITNEIIAKITLTTVPPALSGILISGQTAFVIDAGTIYFINTVTNTLESKINLQRPAYDFAMAHDGIHLVIASYGAAVFFNTVTRTITKTVQLDGTSGASILISQQAPFNAYIPDAHLNTLNVIDTNTQQLIAVRALKGRYPFSSTISPDGNKLFVLNMFTPNISVISIPDNYKFVQSIPFPVNVQGSYISSCQNGEVFVNTRTGSHPLFVINSQTNQIQSVGSRGNSYYTTYSGPGDLAYVGLQGGMTLRDTDPPFQPVAETPIDSPTKYILIPNSAPFLSTASNAPPSLFFETKICGKRKKCCNFIKWQKPITLDPVRYLIYTDEALIKLVGIVPADKPLRFAHYQPKKCSTTYFIVAELANEDQILIGEVKIRSKHRR